MKRSTKIVILLGSVVLIMLVLAIFLSTRGNTIKTLSMKYKGINNVQSLINIKDGSLYFVSNQSLYYLSGSQKNTLQNRISGSNFINHNNFLTYSTYADGDKLNTVKSTVFLKTF